MSILYDFIFLLFSIAYLPYLIFTGRYHKDFWQRLGLYPKDILDELEGKDIIWVHAVSVGEVMAARILCENILERFPEGRLAISTITKTGNDTAKRLFKERTTILYLPVDISLILNRVFEKIRPKLFVIIETEIWPNLILSLHKKSVPVILVNGRISPKSYGNYMKVKFFVKGILEKMTLFCMQNDEYADRIKEIGAPADRVVITGNMKFDVADRQAISEKLDVDAIKSDLNLAEGQPLFIAGSTHRPEEKIVLRVYRNLLKNYSNVKLLIAPRHVERTQEIERLIRRSGFTPVRTSKLTQYAIHNTQYETPVLILDTMGRLNQIFSIGTIIFMGGSLMRKGGQNILEPATFSKPIIFGPHMFNFKDIKDAFLREGAACMVKDEKGLLETTSMLLSDSRKREELGGRAKSLIEKQKGATQRNLKEIVKLSTYS